MLDPRVFPFFIFLLSIYLYVSRALPSFLHLRKAIYRRFCLPIRAEEKRNGRTDGRTDGWMMGTDGGRAAEEAARRGAGGGRDADVAEAEGRGYAQTGNEGWTDHAANTPATSTILTQ